MVGWGHIVSRIRIHCLDHANVLYSRQPAFCEKALLALLYSWDFIIQGILAIISGQEMLLSWQLMSIFIIQFYFHSDWRNAPCRTMIWQSSIHWPNCTMRLLIHTLYVRVCVCKLLVQDIVPCVNIGVLIQISAICMFGMGHRVGTFLFLGWNCHLWCTDDNKLYWSIMVFVDLWE